MQSGISRQDEQQIEQTLQALASLVRLYQGIDYSSPYATKSHAHLAAGYLGDAVQAVIPHDMADVLLEGVRLMGRSAQHFLIEGKPDEVATLTQKIALIACTGCAKENYRPVTMEGMAQLANLTFDVVRCKNRDTRFATGEIRRNVALISQLFLKVPIRHSRTTTAHIWGRTTRRRARRAYDFGLRLWSMPSPRNRQTMRTRKRSSEISNSGLMAFTKRLRSCCSRP